VIVDPRNGREGSGAVANSVTSAEVKRRAAALGFDLCGIAPAADFVELRFLREWLNRGFAGDMQYMHRSAERRADVRNVLPSARSVVCLATIYNAERPYSVQNPDKRQAALARYAWGDDYHVVIERRQNELLAWMRNEAGDAFEGRAYVDTGPVQERVYAQYAGLGWIGKNTCLISPRVGSWLFLSEVICNLELDPDTPALDQCGRCTRCLEACPTGALVEPGVLDSTRCLSYLTIENKGSIPLEYRDAIAGHAYGCDICQEVCPWNLSHKTATTDDPAWQPRSGLDAPLLVDLWRRSDDELRVLLKGSAMKRAGVRRLRRNLAVAIGNSCEREAADELEQQTAPTCDDPLVKDHVTWAVGKLRG
jgi:epoxyqueuosine reductase